MNMDYDTEIERRSHPENFETDTLEEASDLIAVIQDAVSDLSYFSVRHDDIFNGEIEQLEEQLNRCRKQL